MHFSPYYLMFFMYDNSSALLFLPHSTPNACRILKAQLHTQQASSALLIGASAISVTTCQFHSLTLQVVLCLYSVPSQCSKLRVVAGFKDHT